MKGKEMPSGKLPMSKYPELIGQRFGSIIVKERVGQSSRFLCQCDCGNTVEDEGCNLIANRRKTCGKNHKQKDYTGTIVGELIVIEFVGIENEKRMWRCECACGNKDVLLSVGEINAQDRKSCGCKARRAKPDLLIGKVFGKLTVLDYAGIDDKECTWWCKCDCGSNKLIRVTTGMLNSGNRKSCGCLQIENRYRSVGDLCGTYFSQIKFSAKYRNLEFDLTKEYLWQLYLDQNKKCALSGVDLNMERSISDNRETHTVSLDRIDSTKGYVKGNVQFVYKWLNALKQDMTDEEVIKWCHTISAHQFEKESKQWKDSEDTSYICSI